MATLIEAGLPLATADGYADAPRSGDDRVTVLDARSPLRLPSAPVAALSRLRGGTFSATVDVIRFTDGSSAHTDLIRLNPNIDAYSLDFAGVSPRQLSHYREVAWRQAPVRAAVLRHAEINRILVNSYPHLPTAELTRRLRDAGYPIGAGAIREHEAIAATQAAIWRLTNGLELDSTARDEPVRASGRIGEHPSAWVVEPDGEGRLDWHTQLPAGETAYLELEFAGHPQFAAYEFGLGTRTGRHPVTVRLERSADGSDWYPVSRSATELPTGRPGGRRVRRQLGAGATLASASAGEGQRGHRYYRLAATGPADRDGLLELRDVRLELAAGSRFANPDRIVYLYDLLLTQATGKASRLRRTATSLRSGEVLGPFVLADTSAIVTAAEARVIDEDGNGLWGPISPGARFYLHRHPEPKSAQVEVRLHPQHLRTRVLIGSRTPDGPGIFTPLVTVDPTTGAESNQHTIVLKPGS